MYYPATFTPDTNNTFLVEFRDIPEAVGVGETFDEAYLSALDGLEVALFSIYMKERREIPAPSKLVKGEYAIYLPVSVQVKLKLYNEMLAQGISKAELSRRLKVNQKQIDRLWDLGHSSKIELLEQAANKLGKRLEIAFA